MVLLRSPVDVSYIKLSLADAIRERWQTTPPSRCHRDTELERYNKTVLCLSLRVIWDGSNALKDWLLVLRHGSVICDASLSKFRVWRCTFLGRYICIVNAAFQQGWWNKYRAVQKSVNAYCPKSAQTHVWSSYLYSIGRGVAEMWKPVRIGEPLVTPLIGYLFEMN